MLNPSPMQLLVGVADALAADVAPALAPGPVAEQLAAAVAMLRRIARALEDFPAYLLQDLAELSAALEVTSPPPEPPLRSDQALTALPGPAAVETVPAAVPGSPGWLEPGLLSALPPTLPSLGTLIDWDLRLREVLADRCRASPAEQGPLLELLRSLNRREATLRLSPWER